jgi:hypothetical protein
LKSETQRVLQLIYDLFYGSGGVWPELRDLQRALNRQCHSGVDAGRIVRCIPATLLKPPRSVEDYPAHSERLILTAEGIERCAGSSEDVTNLVIAVKWLARLVGRSDSSSARGERGVPFTTRQLAEAVSLPLESDSGSINRLLAILEVEGWVQHGDNRRGKPWSRLLRAS